MEIKCRKPKAPKYFGIAGIYERYSNRWYKWYSLLPLNGQNIKITWLSSCKNVPNGTPNPYIGMTGFVEDMNKNEGSFTLRCATNSLAVSGNFNYEIL